MSKCPNFGELLRVRFLTVELVDIAGNGICPRLQCQSTEQIVHSNEMNFLRPSNTDNRNIDTVGLTAT